jgi:aspartyl-tRNA(Asn)/glutamyl-tRNA(Gln) amidotransferase subunit C
MLRAHRPRSYHTSVGYNHARRGGLANLEFGDAEIERFTRQLSAILDYVAQLDRLNTDAIEPTSHVNAAAHALRDDALQPPAAHEEALANAPGTDRGYFKVPKVIG